MYVDDPLMEIVQILLCTTLVDMISAMKSVLASLAPYVKRA